MANLVDPSYSNIGTRQSKANPSVTEYFNTQTGMGFESPQILSNVANTWYGLNTNAQNVFDVLKAPKQAPQTQQVAPAAPTAPTAPAPQLPGTTPINLDLSNLLNTQSSSLQQPPKSSIDIEKLIQDNFTSRQSLASQIAEAFKPTPLDQQKLQEYQTAQQSALDAQNTLRNFDVSLEGGIQNIMKKPIALEFQQGQQAALTRDAAFTRSSLARASDAAAQQAQLKGQNFQMAQDQANQAREANIQSLQFAMQTGQADFNDLLQLDQLQRQREQDFYAQQDRLTNNARQTLDTILANFQGYSFDQLSPQTQQQLRQLETQAGLPTGTIQSGLQITKDNENLAKAKESKAFAINNNITAPFYDIAGTIFRTSDGKAYSSPEQFFKDGGAQDFSNVQKVSTQAQPIEVSPGATLFDPSSGRPIYTAPTAKQISGSSGSGGVTSSGSGGTSGLSDQAAAVIAGTLKLEDLTPTVRGQIAGELQAAGYQRTQNLNAAQREQIDKLDTLLREADNAKGILDSGLDTGPVASRFKSLQATFGGAQDFTNYRSIVNNLGSILLQARSGAAVTPEEFERIKGFIPLANDDEKTAQTKIDRFKEELSAARNNYINRATSTPQQLQQSTSGQGSDPLGIR